MAISPTESIGIQALKHSRDRSRAQRVTASEKRREHEHFTRIIDGEKSATVLNYNLLGSNYKIRL